MRCGLARSKIHPPPGNHEAAPDLSRIADPARLPVPRKTGPASRTGEEHGGIATCLLPGGHSRPAVRPRGRRPPPPSAVRGEYGTTPETVLAAAPAAPAIPYSGISSRSRPTFVTRMSNALARFPLLRPEVISTTSTCPKALPTSMATGKVTITASPARYE
jgi:hypothetical protein